MRSGKKPLQVALVTLAAALGVACNGPIVARSPEALYALAQEQIGNANYYPAVDTLARVARAAPKSDLAHRALVLRLTLLAGMAQAFQDIAESYLAGHQQAGAAAYSGQMRAVAMDYFGRSRGRSIEMLEALELLLREPITVPVRLGLTLPAAASDPAPVLAKVRQGEWVTEGELGQLEKAEVATRLARATPALAGAGSGPEGEVEPARFYLGLGQAIVELSSIYRPEALADRRLLRLFYERAATAAAQAAQLARAKNDQNLEKESQELLARCQDALKKL